MRPPCGTGGPYSKLRSSCVRRPGVSKEGPHLHSCLISGQVTFADAGTLSRLMACLRNALATTVDQAARDRRGGRVLKSRRRTNCA